MSRPFGDPHDVSVTLTRCRDVRLGREKEGGDLMKIGRWGVQISQAMNAPEGMALGSSPKHVLLVL